MVSLWEQPVSIYKLDISLSLANLGLLAFPRTARIAVRTKFALAVLAPFAASTIKTCSCDMEVSKLLIACALFRSQSSQLSCNASVANCFMGRGPMTQ